MTPIKQQNRHNPAAGVYGDCHRAALASILEMPIQDVPDFCNPTLFGDDWALNQCRWLREQGYTPITVSFQTNRLDDVLYTTQQYNPDTYAILGGKSRNDCGHSVVICNGEIVHDPSQDNSSIVGPMSDGMFWVTFFGHAKAVQRAVTA